MIKLGVVAYLNMQPLVHGLAESAAGEVEVRTGPPSALARWLEAGEIDAGMVPVASIINHPEWSIMPAPPAAPALASMIGSRGPVRSVLVVGSDPPEAWERLRLDAQSQTSNVLAQILLRNAHNAAFNIGVDVPELQIELPEPALHDFIPAAPEPGTAQVLIGSRALEWIGRWGDTSDKGWHWIDMGAAWTQWMQKPFVYALWAVRPGVDLGAWPARLEALKCANLARIPAIAASWPRLREEHLTPTTAVEDLIRNIDFDYDPEAEQGLLRFYREGVDLNLFPPNWHPRWAGAE